MPATARTVAAMSDLPAVHVRPYRACDRPAVRRICVATGYLGDPVQWQWRDDASFADLFCGWYTDHAADSAWVAVRAGRVVGYLLGCADSTVVPDPVRAIVPQVLRRGLLVRPGTAGVLWRGLADGVALVVGGHGLPEPVLDERWPAHLHIDLLPVARGGGVGAQLVTIWLDRLRAEGVAGCHLETMAENTAAIGFFERQGFLRHGEPTPVPGLRARDGSRLHTQLMVQPL
jgi:ribosomal protein S18 acetylase RimI-like enzyme